MIVSTGFHYDNEYSGNKGIVKIRNSGLATDSFLGSVTNTLIKVKNNRKSYLQFSELEPLVIPMALYFDENLDDSTIRGIKKWLMKDDFKELVFEDSPNRMYYAKINGDSNLTHNSISSGYVEFDFVTNSPYTFSRPIEIEGSVSSSSVPTKIEIYSDGDLLVYPTIEITVDAVVANDIEIFNETTGEVFTLVNNLKNELITVLNEYEEFQTSSNTRFCYDDHNGQFISLVNDVNNLQMKGKFKYVFKYQSVYY